MPSTGFLIRSGALSIRSKAFRAGGRGSDFLPIMNAVVELPRLMVSSAGRVIRVINKITRNALEKEMEFHHKVRIPEHFSRFRQKKYNYAARSERTQAIKQRRNQADLVKTKRTRDRMSEDIRITFPRGGGPGVVHCRGTLRWPSTFRRNPTAKRGVTPDVMASEIARFTLQEERTVAEHVRDDVVIGLRTQLSARAKTQLRPQLARLGI